jgi:hypothetical protein
MTDKDRQPMRPHAFAAIPGKTRLALALLGAVVVNTAAFADKIQNPTAVFSGLDKITGRIISFEVGVGETVQFGSLQLTPRMCYSRPSSETPQTDAFIEVDEITFSNEYKRVFSGWVFASSPGLSAIEHPVYDLWLTECKGGVTVIKTEPEQPEQPVLPPKPDTALKPVQDDKIARDRGDQGRINGVSRQTPSQRFFPTNVPPPSQGGGGGRGLPALLPDPASPR